MITGLIALSSFDSLFSPPGLLYLLPPDSLLCLTLWISLGIPSCGEHLRNWLLARLFSPLLTLPLLLGKGNHNPLQYSCLENPRDGGAWWAAVYGVAQSRTQLKWLSSSSSFSSWSPLSPSSLFSSPCNSANLSGYPSLWRIIRCSIICAIWMEKSWGYCKNKTESQRQEA